MDDFNQNALQQLAALPPDEFTPSLSLLDALVGGIAFNK